MTDPLAGLVLFQNVKEVIQIAIGRGYVRISSDAIRLIGDPSFINVFFDESGKRMAVKAATEKMPNVFAVGKHTGLNKCGVILEKIIQVAGVEWHPGEVIRFNGQKYSDYVIFDLSKSKTVRYDDHTSKMMTAKRQKKESA